MKQQYSFSKSPSSGNCRTKTGEGARCSDIPLLQVTHCASPPGGRRLHPRTATFATTKGPVLSWGCFFFFFFLNEEIRLSEASVGESLTVLLSPATMHQMLLKCQHQSILFKGPFMGEELAPGQLSEWVIFFSIFNLFSWPVSRADSVLLCKGITLMYSTSKSASAFVQFLLKAKWMRQAGSNWWSSLPWLSIDYHVFDSLEHNG